MNDVLSLNWNFLCVYCAVTKQDKRDCIQLKQRFLFVTTNSMTIFKKEMHVLAFKKKIKISFLKHTFKASV